MHGPRVGSGGPRWMTFVDGENLTIRAQNLAEKLGADLNEGTFYERDRFVWINNFHARNVICPMMDGQPATRAYYYTSVLGDAVAVDNVEEKL